MGSLFSTPKPTTAPAPSARTPAPQTPAAVSMETTEQATRNARQDALERRRYGRASLIATGYRGLLSDRIASAASRAGGGKNLLGD